MATSFSGAVEFKYGLLTWRSYNSIKKKAMEQEFSWSGLALSLSIAFFIVIGSAQFLNLTYQAMLIERAAKQSAEPAAIEIKAPAQPVSSGYLC